MHANACRARHRRTTDEKERVTARRDYRPFGEPFEWSGAQAGPRELLNTFQGQQFDDTTGLYNFKARHYDAELGRFMSADTVVTDINDPRTLNRYAFEGGNPVNYTDPTGRDFLGIGAWVDGAVSDAGDWIDGAISDAGAWFDGAFADIGTFFETYGTYILVGVVAVTLIGLGVFTGGSTTILGLALIGGGLGFAVGGGIAAGLGYKADDWQFWAAAGIGAGIGAAGAVAFGGAGVASVGGGVSLSAKSAIVVGATAKGTFWGGVAGIAEGVIGGLASGSSVDETFNFTLDTASEGLRDGFLFGAVAGGGRIVASGSKLGKFAWGVGKFDSLKGKASLVFVYLASSGSGRPTDMEDNVYDSDFDSAAVGARPIVNQTGAALAPIASGLGGALGQRSSAQLVTSPAIY